MKDFMKVGILHKGKSWDLSIRTNEVSIATAQTSRLGHQVFPLHHASVSKG